MRLIKTSEDLKAAISELKIRQENETSDLKKQIGLFKENMRPANLLKSTLADVSSSTDLKSNLITGVIGLAAGYLTKRAVFGASPGPVKKLLGNLLQVSVAGSAPVIRNIGVNLFKSLMRRKEEKKKQTTPKKDRTLPEEEMLFL